MYISPINRLNQFIPEQFKSESFRTIVFNNSNYLLKVDYLSDLFHSFYIKYLRLKDVDNQSIITINLSSVILRKKYGNNYKYYVQFLMDNEIITLKRNYTSGVRCKQYQFRLSYLRKQKIIPFRNHNWKLINYYNDFPIKENDIYGVRLRNYIKSSLKHITINYNRSKDYLESIFSDEISRKYKRNLHSIRDIEDGNIYVKFDKYGRIHTNYTVLKKKIRTDYLFIDGNPIYERDIANSQALFFLFLLSQNLNKSINRTELLRFKTYIIKGTFYDDICQFTNKKSRDEVKVSFFKYLFGVKYQRFPEFEDLYPTISNYIFNYKSSLGDFKLLSQKLQGLEGEFIFNQVCKVLYKKKVVFFTVHDSICVAEKNQLMLDAVFDQKVDGLTQRIEDNISNFYGE